jgi:Integral membrane protein (PIN domain superfamily)
MPPFHFKSSQFPYKSLILTHPEENNDTYYTFTIIIGLITANISVHFLFLQNLSYLFPLIPIILTYTIISLGYKAIRFTSHYSNEWTSLITARKGGGNR